MAQVLVRGLDDDTVAALKARAKQHNRSLQSEIKAILEERAQALTIEDFAARATATRRKLAGKRFRDSTALIRKDRAR